MAVYMTEKIRYPSQTPVFSISAQIRSVCRTDNPGKLCHGLGTGKICDIRPILGDGDVGKNLGFSCEISKSKNFKKYRYFSHFLGLRVAEGLYIATGDLTRAMWAKLVVILPSRTIFRPHFALRTLCDTSEICVHEWS